MYSGPSTPLPAPERSARSGLKASVIPMALRASVRYTEYSVSNLGMLTVTKVSAFAAAKASFSFAPVREAA